ncbi:unnamed protein product [Ectocarpus sp. 6 AP-2014]
MYEFMYASRMNFEVAENPLPFSKSSASRATTVFATPLLWVRQGGHTNGENNLSWVKGYAASCTRLPPDADTPTNKASKQAHRPPPRRRRRLPAAGRPLLPHGSTTLPWQGIVCRIVAPSGKRGRPAAGSRRRRGRISASCLSVGGGGRRVEAQRVE